MDVSNLDLTNLVTPVRIGVLTQYLKITNYDQDKSNFLIQGFSQGFDLGYRGNTKVRLKAPNLRLTVGDETELWNKVMKEVGCKRYAGPFLEVPYTYYIQSPIGLVPKDNGKTRLIFHLSYPRNSGLSVNENTPKSMSTVEYADFDQAVRICLNLGVGCFAAKSDLTSAFRHICIGRFWWRFLVMKAKSPKDGKWYYFVDKCMPFGASISCSIFQSFSDALAHITRFYTEQENINYLDDFFFAALLKAACDRQISIFLDICQNLNFPVSLEKTEWGRKTIVFLGLLINTQEQLVCIPIEKVIRATELIKKILASRKNKTTVGDLQKLTGFLNFLCKAIVPGRVFTRRLYAHTGSNLKKHHHVYLNQEIKCDLNMWLTFLQQDVAYSRPFADFGLEHSSETLDWYTDASTTRGCGGYFNSHWFIAEWEHEKGVSPSINYLELFALTASVLSWGHLVKNKRISIFCDNMSVVHMVNNTTSACRNCMVLLRIITLLGLIHNLKITCKHVIGTTNRYADFLSRLEYKKFRQLARTEGKLFDKQSTPMPDLIWPMSKIWIKNTD